MPFVYRQPQSPFWLFFLEEIRGKREKERETQTQTQRESMLAHKGIYKEYISKSVNGNCFPSLKIVTFKLTMWGKQNHKYEFLFRQYTAFAVFLLAFGDPYATV